MKARTIAACMAALTVAAPAHGANIFVKPRPFGGSYLFVVGEIHPGDEATFADLTPSPPVYVRPIGPGGSVATALTIADTVWQRGYATGVQNNDTDGSGVRGCASACTIIWLSGSQVMAQSRAILQFHSCYNKVTNKDDLRCNLTIAEHLQKYGYTAYQASALANASPHETARIATQAWAASLGFTWQMTSGYGGAGNNCSARFCVW